MSDDRPGSAGEHALQERYGTFKRAAAFYDKQMLDHLNLLMKGYLARQEMAFISTSDANGECDASFRGGPPGFVRVLDDRTIMYPEYRGNGVMASLGNIAENPHIGLLFVDFFHSGVGLHINGRARIIDHAAVEAFAPLLRRIADIGELSDAVAGKHETPERWVLVDIVEAYIHCSKHIPILAPLPGSAGYASPSGDHFRAKDEPRPWQSQLAATCTAFEPDEDPVPAGPMTDASRDQGIEAFVEIGGDEGPPSAPAPVSSSPPASAPGREIHIDDIAALMPPAWEPVTPTMGVPTSPPWTPTLGSGAGAPRRAAHGGTGRSRGAAESAASHRTPVDRQVRPSPTGKPANGADDLALP